MTVKFRIRCRAFRSNALAMDLYIGPCFGLGGWKRPQSCENIYLSCVIDSLDETKMYLWWSSCTLYLLACQVRVTAGGD